MGAAFDMAKEGAVQTALDQIASQFKLENMGSYLDVLQQEARYLNDLTQDQNKILENSLPTSINENFNKVITTQVGSKLDALTSSLKDVVNKISVDTKKGVLENKRDNLTPIADPKIRAQIIDDISKMGDLQDAPSKSFAITPAQRDRFKKEKSDLEEYFKSLDILKIQSESAYVTPQGKGDTELSGDLRRNKNFDTSTLMDKELAIETQKKYLGVDSDKLKSRLDQLNDALLRRTEERNTYSSTAKGLNTKYGVEMSASQLKLLKETIQELKTLDNAPISMPSGSNNANPSLQSIIDQYGLADQAKTPPLQSIIDQYGLASQNNTPSKLIKTREAVDRSNNQTISTTANEELQKQVNDLLSKKDRNVEQEAELLKKQIQLRDRTLAKEKENAEYNYKLNYETPFGDKSFKDERAAFANARIESNARQGNVDIGAITEKNTTYNKADFARDTGQLIDTFQTDFKSGIGSAFGEAIKGTKTLKDAFRDMFQGILNRMLDKSLEMGVDALFAFGKAATTGRKDGGLIRGYNSGGMVTGGSGMKDDVPAMMSGGEYVIKKSSVDKYGTDYLRNLNGGAIPRYATGGFSIDPLQNEFLYDNPDRPTSGEFAVDSRLSAMALTDENNPQNKLRQDRYEKLDQYLQDRAQYEAEKKQSLKNYKNQVNSTFYSGLTAAGIQLASAGLTMGAEKLRTQGYAGTTAGRLESGVGTSPEMMTVSNGRATMPRRRAFGGFIAKFAGGGSTGKDNIPALLMGGEYVMNKKAVDMYGKDFMGQLNSGSLPKYASGGMVGTSYNGQTNTDQSSSMDELVTALNALNDNLSKDSGITQSESGRTSAAGATQESGMSVVNNISINMSQGGEVTSEANSSTQKDASNSKNDQNSMQNNSKLAELLRSKVVEVLVEQQRPGGLLYASR